MAKDLSRPPGQKRSFRQWRRARPFWGGVLTLLAGAEIFGLTAGPFTLSVLKATATLSSILIPLVLLILVIATWRQVELRSITGPVIIVLALATLVVANLGGFVIGMLLGVIGGSLIFAWTPLEDEAEPGTVADEQAADDREDELHGYGAAEDETNNDPSLTRDLGLG